MAIRDEQDDLSNGRLIEHWGELVREWQHHRITVNNAIGILSHELLQLRDWMDKDDKRRDARQAELDARLDAIQDNQRSWIRFTVAVALTGVGMMLGIVIASWLL
jgi:hypothetical protein